MARYVARMHEWIIECNEDTASPPIVTDGELWKMNVMSYSDGTGNDSDRRAYDRSKWTVIVPGKVLITKDELNLIRIARTQASFAPVTVYSMTDTKQVQRSVQCAEESPQAPYDP